MSGNSRGLPRHRKARAVESVPDGQRRYLSLKVWTAVARRVAASVLWLALAALPVGVVAHTAAEDYRLAAHGVATQATIDIVHSGRNGYLTVSFLAENCVWRADLHATDLRVLPGRSITVLYDPADPSNVRTPGSSENFGIYLLVGPLALLTLFGAAR